MRPNRTISNGPVAGTKQSKDCITVLFTCNATGTILAAHIKWNGKIPYPIPSYLPKSHPNPKSQSHPYPKSQIPSHIPNNLIGHLSRDVTQISKKGNFASRKKWRF
ncbi:hypothetical protein RhiirA5_447091 [Rhizophagus irregularis]|uniref:Uncharacterized protein n=1 Tax=Rhizophagus irregularis TaxID=588596 RepID=A0A2N0NBE1_9GLOM|nr:hypothetical protein RhiirA5_447091 [Rhizophagus irregularis]